MNKNFLYVAIGVIVLGLIAFFIFGKGSKSKKKAASGQEESVNSGSDSNLYPMGSPESNIWDDALSSFQGDDKMGYIEFLEALKTGKKNFVWEVWALRRQCPEDYTPEQCNNTIMVLIDKNYPKPENESMKALFNKYFEFEKSMREFKTPENSDFSQRYELIKEQRKKIMGNENASLIFGMEESQVEFLDASKNFFNSSKNLKGDERVSKYESLRKKTYGSYYDAILSREDKFQNYQTELELRDKDLTSLSQAEKDKKLRSIQEKFFVKEGADSIAKVQKETDEYNKKISDYQKQESEFLSANASLSDKEKAVKLEEMRIKALGKEEAEAYARRADMDKLEKSVK
jgi:hypothetical protein